MEHISKHVTLARPTPDEPVSTKALAKFNDFLTLKDPALERMRDAACKFLVDLSRNETPYWLSLLGPSGIGKSMLAKIIWRWYRDNRHWRINWTKSKSSQTPETPHGRVYHHEGGFLAWQGAINRMVGRYEFAFLDDVRSYDFFVLDDVMAESERHHDLSVSKLYDIFESRQHKWTVITCNRLLQQISDHGDARLASRMIRHNGVVIETDVRDFNTR